MSDHPLKLNDDYKFINGNPDGNCPFMGMRSDPSTFCQYPSTLNHCFRSEKPQPIRLDHQVSYCLTDAHTRCPIYRDTGTLPEGISSAGVEPVPNSRGRIILFAFMGVLVVVLVGASIFGIAPLVGLGGLLSEPLLPAPQATETPLPTSADTSEFVQATETESVPSPAATDTPTPVFTDTPVPTTKIPSITPTPFPTPGPGLGTPFGTNPQFVIHVVQAGESFTRIAEQYGTSNEALEAANVLLKGQSLWAGMQIVVPIGVTEPVGLPKFEIYFVVESIALEELAEQFQSDVEEIRHYNGIGSDPVIPAGRWLIIPVFPE